MPALIGTVLALAAHAADDPRLITNGHLMYTWAYADQPYCVVFPREPEEDRPGRWLCTVTVNDNTHEGGAGEHVVSVYSDDRGVRARLWTTIRLPCSLLQMGRPLPSR